jgi:hypothetical protein
MSRLFAAVLAVALGFAYPTLAAPAAPGSVDPSTPAAPPATLPPAAASPAATAPAAIAPQQSTESAKPKPDAKQRRRAVRHHYRYAYRDPFYYWHPRFWWSFRPYRYRAYRYPRRYAYHRYHRRHDAGGAFFFR